MKELNVCTGTAVYSYTYNDKQALAVFYEFIMGNKHEVLGSKAKLWESGDKASSRRRQ